MCLSSLSAEKKTFARISVQLGLGEVGCDHWKTDQEKPENAREHLGDLSVTSDLKNLTGYSVCGVWEVERQMS